MFTKRFHILSVLLTLAFAFAAFGPTVVSAKDEAADPNKDLPTIVGTAAAVNASSGEFSTLIAALKRAGLLEKFNGSNQFTVFAPTDAAFAKLGLNAENVKDLPSGALQKILAYHVLRGARYSDFVLSREQLKMLNGDSAAINGGTIDGAPIVTANIPTSNGVIHVIGSVMLP